MGRFYQHQNFLFLLAVNVITHEIKYFEVVVIK